MIEVNLTYMDNESLELIINFIGKLNRKIEKCIIEKYNLENKMEVAEVDMALCQIYRHLVNKELKFKMDEKELRVVREWLGVQNGYDTEEIISVLEMDLDNDNTEDALFELYQSLPRIIVYKEWKTTR